jgi:hypothetical protein
MMYRWLFFAVSSLVFAGVFAFLAAMTRTPAVKLLPRADYFQVSIVAHVIFSLVVWFLGFMGVLWCYSARNRKTGWDRWAAGLWLAVVGMALLAVSSLLGLGEPTLIDYVPLLDHPVYFAGLFFISLGIALTIIQYAIPIVKGEEPGLKVPAYGMLVTGAIVLVAFFSVFFSAVSNGYHSYRTLFWGPGHIIQFANTAAMVVVWYILLKASINSRINDELFKKLLLTYLLIVLILPLIFFLPTHQQTRLFTLGMGYGIGIPSFFLGLMIVYGIWQGVEDKGLRGLPWRSPAFASLVLSVALFVVGGAIGVPGLESNLRVPAHYHGALGAVTMGFMGMTSIVLRELNVPAFSDKAARIQPYLYGLGLLVIITGLFWAGSYGAPRKAFGYEDPITALAMNVMGLGAVIAVLGGAVFVANTLLALLKSRNQ